MATGGRSTGHTGAGLYALPAIERRDIDINAGGDFGGFRLAVARRVQSVLGDVVANDDEDSWAYCTRLDEQALSRLPALQARGLSRLLEWVA